MWSTGIQSFCRLYSIKGYYNGCSLLCYTTYPFAYFFFLKFEYSCIMVCVSLCYAAEGTSHTGIRIPSLGIASPLRSLWSSEGFLCHRGVLTRYLLYTQQCVYANIYSSPHPSIPSLVSIRLFSMSMSLEKYICQRPRCQYLTIKLYINMNLTV